jgi:N6-adenosine-specific RNA methylase IME4
VGEKLAENGLLGVWITNKPAFRELLLGKDGEGGLFEYWGIERIEEWIWLKITSGGEPVTAIDGTWRKPYEILLVGRKLAESKSQQAQGGRDGESHIQSNGGEKKEPEEDQDPESESPAVRRRIILAVPDLHSRKPRLAELFRAHFPSPPHSLEIFARSLAADSWSWGDEVLKFQHLSHWTEVVHEAYHEEGAQADGPET